MNLNSISRVNSNQLKPQKSEKMNASLQRGEIKELYPKNYQPFLGIKSAKQEKITPLEVDSSKVETFDNEFIKADLSELSDYDFYKYKDTGIPLKYPRADFIADLSEILSHLPEDGQNQIYKKLEITPVITEGIKGYDGIINPIGLDLENDIEAKISEKANKFLRQNEVLLDDEAAGKNLNTLISAMPEFINIIGKPQHFHQPYVLDIHTLTALSRAMKSYDYKELAPEDKACLKYFILLHDVAKPSGVNDKNHPHNSALWADKILTKYPLSDSEKERIVKLIENHHWLEDYGTKAKTANQIAQALETPSNWQIAKLMTEADLRASGGKIFSLFAPELSDWKLEPITKEINNLAKI